MAPRLASLFDEVVAGDRDAAMLAEGRRETTPRGVENVVWVQLAAEDLPAGLGVFRVVAFAQSSHWMDQPRVARRVRGMLEPGGAWVHVLATSHAGVGTDPNRLPWPAPPRAEITVLVDQYVGPVRHAGTRPARRTCCGRRGFRGPRRLEIGHGRVGAFRGRGGSVDSVSWAAPHLFGDHAGEFDADLRRLLSRASPTGRFSEQAREVALTIWTPQPAARLCNVRMQKPALSALGSAGATGY